MNHKIVLSKGKSLDKSKIQAVLVLLVAAWVLPFLIHLLPPHQGIPMGAFLLPMFYIPFIAVFLVGLPLGLGLAASIPILNYFITGSPNWEFMALLSFELSLFSIFSFVLLQTNWQKVSAPLSYVLAKILSSTFLLFIPLLQVSPMDFFINSLSNAAPGILVLFVLNWVLIEKWKK